MRITVCLKWVDLRPEIDPLTGSVSTDPRFSGASPADRAALEWGLRLADTFDGTVTAVTFGPPDAEGMLRDALAIGVHRVVLLEAGGGHDQAASRSVAARLAVACADAEIVCCGLHSVDRGSGSVPVFLADELRTPHALGLVTIEPQAGPDDATRSIVVERRLDHGRRERLKITGRCVLSFEGGLEPRRASLSASLAATSATVERVDLAQLGRVGHGRQHPPDEPVVVASGPYRPRAKVKPPPDGTTHERVVSLVSGGTANAGTAVARELGPEEAAEVVVDQLVSWGYLERTTSADVDGGTDGPEQREDTE